MEQVSVPALAEAVRQRTPGAPLDRIEAALAVGDDLLSGADELIGLFVAEARAAGCSWTEIGQRIGVSKQAARQRFTQAPAVTSASGLELRPRLIACLAAAAREASADGSAEIGTHHQLIGLFQEGVAAAILEKIGARRDAVRTAARELFPGESHLADRPSGSGTPPGSGPPQGPGPPRESGTPRESRAPRGSGPPPESAEAREAVQGAAALARRGHCDYVGTEHLLGALALDPGSRARRVLINLGISIPGIKRELECYISPRRRRRRRGKTAEAACSFCGKLRSPALRLVAGPGVYICAECVRLCNEIIAEETSGPEARR